MFIKRILISFILISVSLLHAQNKFGIDIPFYFSNSIVLVPGAFSTIEGEGGNGKDIGIGIFLQASENFKFKAGIHFWNKRFNPTHTGNFTIDNNDINGKLVEEGNVSYSGIYLLALYETRIAYIGGGFDISFSNSYEADLKAYDSNGNLIGQANGIEESFLTEKFNNQFDLAFHLGFKIKLNERFSLVPNAQLTIPIKSLFDTNVTVYNPVFDESGEAAFSVLYGLSVEFKL
jgi:hypothetical protein